MIKKGYTFLPVQILNSPEETLKTLTVKLSIENEIITPFYYYQFLADIVFKINEAISRTKNIFIAIKILICRIIHQKYPSRTVAYAF